MSEPMSGEEAQYTLRHALEVLDAEPLPISRRPRWFARHERGVRRERERDLREWDARQCRCGLCHHRVQGVRGQYLNEGRCCACGYCPLWAPFPTCAVKEWQTSL